MDFKEWERMATSTIASKVSYNTVRDIYALPYSGIKIMHDVHIPKNVYRKSTEVAVVCYALPNSEREKVEKAGGYLSDDYHTEEGYGTPVFQTLEAAYNFGITIDNGNDL